MAISPPQFNVPLLSPAALLSGQDNRRSETSRALEQVTGFALQSVLQGRQLEAAQARQDAALDAAAERAFNRDIAEGDIVPVSEDNPAEFEFLGESITLPTVEVNGTEVFRPSDRARAMQSVQMAQELGPEEGFLPNTRVGQVTARAGESGPTQEDRDRRTLAPGGTAEAFKTVIDTVSDPALKQRLTGHLNAVLSDQHVTLAERDFLMEEGGFDEDTLRQWTDLRNDIANSPDDTQAMIYRRTQEILDKYRYRQDQSTPDAPVRRRMRFSEADLVATAQTDPDMLGEQGLARAKDIMTRMDLNDEIPNMEEEFRQRFNLTAQPSSDEHLDAVAEIQRWVRNFPEIEEMVSQSTAASGDTSFAGISNFLQSNTAQARAVRGAFTVYNYNKSTLQDLQGRGVDYPFGLSGAGDIMNIVRPSWNDAPDTGFGRGVRPNRPLTEEEEAEVRAELQGEVDNIENFVSDFFTPTDTERLRGILTQEDPQAVADDLQALVTATRDDPDMTIINGLFTQLLQDTQDPTRWNIFKPMVLSILEDNGG